MPDVPQSAATAKRRLAALSEQLVAPVPDQGSFEGIPKLRKIAGDSDSKRLTGKVAIITGMCGSVHFMLTMSEPVSVLELAPEMIKCRFIKLKL